MRDCRPRDMAGPAMRSRSSLAEMVAVVARVDWLSPSLNDSLIATAGRADRRDWGFQVPDGERLG